MMDLRELYQDIILDHGRHPRNFRRIEHPTHFAHGHNPLCGDRVTGGEAAELPEPLAEEAERLEPLTGVKAYPARVKCATLSWHALEAALKSGGAGATVKTE